MDDSAALVLASFDSPEEVIVHRSQMYTWGNNQLGQTGHTGTCMKDPRAWKVQRSPKLMEQEHFKGDAAFLKVACGLQHTGALTRDGGLFMWGSNDCGQLGDGTETDRRQPRRVKALQNEFITSIACGHQSSAALARPRNKKGAPLRLWVWGQHQGSNFPGPFHGAFAADTPIVAVSLGAAHAAAVSAGGQLMTWGYNEVGQLGHGFSSEGLQPARLVRAFIQHTSDTPVCATVKKVACGAYHTACVSDAGEVYTFGHGAMGQLGHRTLQGRDREVNPRRVVSLEGQHVRQIACGQAHTCAITSKGTLYMWGGHREGQLGLGRPTYMFPFIDSNDSNDFFRRLPTVLLPRGAKMVVCGQTHTLACTMDGRLWGWGYNSCGQAATGKATHAWVPTPIDWCVGEIAGLAAGGGHSAVLTRACSLKDLCELRLAESLDLNTICRTKAVAAQMHADSLARYCELYRLKALGKYQDEELDEDEDRRRRPR